MVPAWPFASSSGHLTAYLVVQRPAVAVLVVSTRAYCMQTGPWCQQGVQQPQATSHVPANACRSCHPLHCPFRPTFVVLCASSKLLSAFGGVCAETHGQRCRCLCFAFTCLWALLSFGASCSVCGLLLRPPPAVVDLSPAGQDAGRRR